jgi:hypothetical protein
VSAVQALGARPSSVYESRPVASLTPAKLVHTFSSGDRGERVA